jgi:hypothetical protein
MPNEISPLASSRIETTDATDRRPSDSPVTPVKDSPARAWPDRRFDSLPPSPGLPRPSAQPGKLMAETIQNLARHTDTDTQTLDLALLTHWYQAALYEERRGILLTGIAASTSPAAPPPQDILEGTVSLSVSPDGKPLKKPLILPGIASLPLSQSSEPLQRLLENPRLDDPAVYEKIFIQALDKAPRMAPAERKPLLSELARHIEDLEPARQSHYFFEILAEVQKDLGNTWPLSELIDQISLLPERNFEAFSGCLAMVERLPPERSHPERLSYFTGQLIYLLPSLEEHFIDGMTAVLAAPQPEGTAHTALEDRRLNRYELATACLKQTRYALPRYHSAAVSLLIADTQRSDLGEYQGAIMSKIALELPYLSLAPADENRIKAAVRPYMPPGF